MIAVAASASELRAAVDDGSILFSSGVGTEQAATGSPDRRFE